MRWRLAERLTKRMTERLTERLTERMTKRMTKRLTKRPSPAALLGTRSHPLLTPPPPPLPTPVATESLAVGAALWGATLSPH